MQRTLPRAPFRVMTLTPCPIALDPLPFHVMIFIQHARLTLTRAALMRRTLHRCARPVDLNLADDAYIRLLDRADHPRPRSSRSAARSSLHSFPSAACSRLRTAAGRGSAPSPSRRVRVRRAGAGSAAWVGRTRGKARGGRGGASEKRVHSFRRACDTVHFHDICHVQRTVYPESCVTPTHVKPPF